jgi:translation initiation factor IF-1
LVTDLVPSEMACLASSPGRMRRTEVWISREEMVDFFEYDASSAWDVRGEIGWRTQRARTGRLSGDTLEDVVDKGVEDGHRLVGNTSVGVDLLKDCKAG